MVSEEVIKDKAHTAWYYALGQFHGRDEANASIKAGQFSEYVRSYVAINPRVTIQDMFADWRAGFRPYKRTPEPHI